MSTFSRLLRTPLCIGLLALVLTLGLFQPGQLAYAQGASITLSPSAGLPTSTVLVKGTQFGSQEIVTLRFDSTSVGNAATSSTGRFSTIISIPQKASIGFHKVTAHGESSGLIASARFKVLPADWPTFGFDANHSHFNSYENQLSPSTVSHLTLAWSFPTGDYIDTSPAVVGGVIFVGADQVYALDATSGTQLWSFSGDDYFSDSPAVANGIVYISIQSSYMYAIDAATGTQIWKDGIGRFISASPVVANGLVYIGSWGDDQPEFQAIDAVTGQERWYYEMSHIYSSPAVANGVVYVADAFGTMYALNAATGATVWRFRTGKTIESSPSVVDGIVYIGGDKLYALDAATGARLWSFSRGGGSSPAVANGMVYVNSDQLYALDAKTGTKLWSSPNPGSSPTVANGVVYTISDQLYALDATTGTRLWSYPISGDGYSSPAVVNGMVYVSSGKDEYAFHLPTAGPPLNR